MTPATKARVIAIAREEAAQWFSLQRESDLPDIDPNEAWAALNAEFSDNARDGAEMGRPSAMDHLFERAYRYEMARRWADACWSSEFCASRVPTQVSIGSNGDIVALCSDGAVMHFRTGQGWSMLPAIPHFELPEIATP